ncbi:Hypothetical protein POVR1_LOCUS417 [uncultured virus]|nr:Hypothetical protein POVR1_LOCUS417 [uncultured virus]
MTSNDQMILNQYHSHVLKKSLYLINQMNATTWEAYEATPDALRNVLLHLPRREAIKFGEASENGKKILNDQTFWKRKFEIDKPELYRKIEMFLSTDTNWGIHSSNHKRNVAR